MVAVILKRIFYCRRMHRKCILGLIVCCTILIFVLRNSYGPHFKSRLDGKKETWTENEIRRYCSPTYQDEFMRYPVNSPTGKLKLHAVVMIMRHGDRSPISMHRSYFEHNDQGMCKLRNQEIISSVTRLKEALQDSIPKNVDNFSWFPDTVKCSPAQLTTKGMHQLYKLGQKFASKYPTLLDGILQSGKRRSLDNQESDSKNVKDRFIYLRTTEYERTFQSGVAFMAGLLTSVFKKGPNFSIDQLLLNKFLNEIVVIKSTPNIWQCSKELYSTGGMESPPCFCQRVEAISKVKQPKVFSAKEKEILLQAKRSTTSFYGASSSFGLAAEGIVSFVCNGAGLPCMSAPPTHDGIQTKGHVCMTWKDVGDVLEGIKVVERAEVIDQNLRLLNILHIYPFLWELWYKLSLLTVYEKKTDKKKPAFLIYSSHDSTILPLLQILGLEKNLWWPAFSSSVVVELHSGSSKQFYFRVFYDDIDVTMKLPFCRGRFTNVDDLCLFDNLNFYVLNELRENFDGEHYNEFCEH